MSNETMKLALEAYIKAGIGNSTDFELQKKAHDLAVEALAKQEQVKPLCTAAMFDDAFLAKSGLSPDTKLYTTPPQRTWVGLTEKDVNELCCTFIGQFNKVDFIKGVEAKLKEKNT
jgi:hypothetical protein